MRATSALSALILFIAVVLVACDQLASSKGGGAFSANGVAGTMVPAKGNVAKGFQVKSENYLELYSGAAMWDRQANLELEGDGLAVYRLSGFEESTYHFRLGECIRESSSSNMMSISPIDVPAPTTKSAEDTTLVVVGGGRVGLVVIVPPL